MKRDILVLSDLKKGMPGITPVEGAYLHENAIIALHNAGHHSMTTISLSGITDKEVDILTIHNEAMDIAALGDKAKKEGFTDKAISLYAEAYGKELEVLSKLDDTNSSLIGRTFILRSAATLALQCRLKRDAERLIAKGLSEDIPDSLMAELRELLHEVYADEFDDSKSVCEITLPNSDKSFLTSLISHMGWTGNFRKIAML